MSADLVILLILIVLAAAIAVSTVVALYTRRKNKLPARPTAEVEAPEPEKKAPEPEAPEPAAPAVVEAPALEEPEAPASRMARLRRRLAGSNNALARGLAQLLSADRIDDDTWDDFETTLITSDLGVAPTTELVEKLRGELAIDGVSDPERARSVLTRELTALVSPDLDRSLNLDHPDGKPAVVMMVGVNGTGKTTTCGKLARVLVAQDKTVVLGAADTFRAAAAEQLSTWGERVGVDVVLVDTAGRLHTKTGLMDELGKVKRVIEKLAPVSEVLLVLDATTGQNGLIQARIFSEVVDVSGIVLSKLDGSAKGGIVVQVQRELGVPVKLIGLGEGADDLAPFEPDQFVAGLMGE